MIDERGFGATGEARRAARASRWPEVVGTIGVVLSVIILLDKLDDLATLTWTEEEWSRFVGAPLAAAIVRALPPSGWRLMSSLMQMALAVLLFSGSMRLRRRRRSGVSRCRWWAALAIVWAAVEIGWAIWWLSRLQDEILEIPPSTWSGFAGLGILVALVVLLAYPVFLLIWLSRPDVRAEHESWRA